MNSTIWNGSSNISNAHWNSVNTFSQNNPSTFQNNNTNQINNTNQLGKGWNTANQNNNSKAWNTNNQNKTKMKEMETKINKLEKKIDNLSQSISKRKYSEITHHSINCNNCQKYNITGIRYLCGNCQNIAYNLCHNCIKYAEEIHPQNHFFIRIPDSRLWNQMNNISHPIQNNYNV